MKQLAGPTMKTRGASVAPAPFEQKGRTVEVLWTTRARVARDSWAREEEFE